MNNDKYETINRDLICEADVILNEIGLKNLLSQYGIVMPTGSYSLKTMTWRDLDIYLIMDNVNKEKFFQLGQEVSLLLNPHRMSFRDEYIGQTEGLPCGYYWGIYSNIRGWAWKIDVWAMDIEQGERRMRFLEEIRKGLTEPNRKAILEIKAHFCHTPEYRTKITSMDIYNSVINEGINSVEMFKQWRCEKELK